MSRNRRNRLFFLREDSEDENKPIKRNRINRISKIEFSKKKYFPLIIIISAAVVALASVFVITNFFYKKPQIFTQSEPASIVPESEKKEIPTIPSTNTNLEKGKENYLKGYYNNAISYFNEVIESGSSDSDKATALTYIGIIHDDRGNYSKAIEYYKRALKYNDKNETAYRNLAIAYRHKNDYEAAAKAAEKGLGINPDNLQNRILLGNILYEQGKYKDAISEYQGALKLNPQEPVALHNIALALLKTGNELSGIEYLKKASSSDGEGNIAHLSYSKLGVLYIEKKDYELAEKYLRMAESLNPEDPIVRYNLGIVYLKTNQSDKALLEFQKAEELGKNDENLLESLGETYLNLNDYDKSIEAYNKLLDSNRRNIKVLSRLAEIYHEKGDLEKAIELYKRITTIEPATENARVAYANMGNILDDLGRSDEAIETYNKALAVSGDDDSTLYNLGIAYKNAGKYELAIQSWQKASDLNPDNPKPLLAIAGIYEEKNFYDLAIDEYQKIVKRWGNLQEAHFNLGSLYFKKNLFDYSKEEFKKVIDINSNNDIARKAYINLGITLSKNAGDNEALLDEAQGYIQKALLLKPNDAEALISLGSNYFKKGMLDKAIDTFYMAISSSRDSKLIAEAYNNIGKCYHKKGQYQNALKAFTRGIEEDPTIEEIRINRKVSMQAYESELQRE